MTLNGPVSDETPLGKGAIETKQPKSRLALRMLTMHVIRLRGQICETCVPWNESGETSEQIRLKRLQRFQRDENEFQDQAARNRVPFDLAHGQGTSGSEIIHPGAASPFTQGSRLQANTPDRIATHASGG